MSLKVSMFQSDETRNTTYYIYEDIYHCEEWVIKFGGLSAYKFTFTYSIIFFGPS